MSAYEGGMCVECGSARLNPKNSGESGVYTCECEDCGFRGLYILEEEPETQELVADQMTTDPLDDQGLMCVATRDTLALKEEDEPFCSLLSCTENDALRFVTQLGKRFGWITEIYTREDFNSWLESQEEGKIVMSDQAWPRVAKVLEGVCRSRQEVTQEYLDLNSDDLIRAVEGG